MEKNIFNNLPLFTAELRDSDAGIFTIALVEWPAFEKRWEFFEKEPPAFKYSVIDEEQHRVISPIIRCDYPILRRDGNGKYFYVTFPRETVYEAAKKFLKEGFQGLVKLTHSPDGPFIEGFDLVQWFIKDPERGINPEGFEDVAPGSLFAEYFVTNEDIWRTIVDGTFNGLSMEAQFNLSMEVEDDTINSIEDLMRYLGISDG